MLSALGKIDVDETEIGFQALARIVAQGDKRLALTPPLAGQVAPDLVVAPAIGMLGTQPTIELHGRVPLLGRGFLIGFEDLVDDAVEGAQHGCRSHLTARVGSWFGVVENLPHLVTRMVKGASDGSNAHAIPMGQTDPCVLVHRDHP